MTAKKIQPVSASLQNKPANDNASRATEADKIWSEIKDKKIEMFALPSQIVSQYFQPVLVEPSKLYLTINVSSALPALELALGDAFVVDRAERFVTVARKV